MKTKKAKPIALRKELKPQAAVVLDYLASRGPISQVVAVHYGIMSLTSRISELKAAGVPIKREFKTDHLGKRYASYSLAH